MESELMGLSGEGVGRKSVGCTISAVKLGYLRSLPLCKVRTNWLLHKFCGVAVPNI